jgi:RNA ligase
MAVVESNEAFTHKVEEVDGWKFHIFNYRLAQYSDFMDNPVTLEMRGLTFLEYFDHSDASAPKVYERFLHLHKFFNCGQGDHREAEKYADQEIVRVQNKEDGSMIVPIVVGGKIYCKTRGTFFSEMAQDANKMIEADECLREFILINHSLGYATFWEYTGPYNQIVLRYHEKELRLLQIRHVGNGHYIQFTEDGIRAWQKRYGIQVAPLLIIPQGTDLEYWVEDVREGTGFEGYVITFKNGHMIKLKTDWYVHLHHLLTENLTRENELIKLVLEEQLDDVLVQVPQDDIRRKYALDIARFVLYKMTAMIQESYGWVIVYDGDRKSFAIKHKGEETFGAMMKMIDLQERNELTCEKAFDIVKAFVLRCTDKWQKAQKFLKDAGFQSEHQPPSMEE